MISTKKGYELYTTSYGVELEIHAVPQQLLRAIVPDIPKPIKPVIDMPLPKGGSQKRPIKNTDPGWEEYQEAMDAWEKARNTLQEAVTFCWACKTYPFPEPLTFSKEMNDLVNHGLIKIPEDDYLRKMFWLRENVIGQHDEFNITMIINKLSGVPEEVIDQYKDSFRNTLLGKTSERVGDTSESDSKSEDAVQE